MKNFFWISTRLKRIRKSLAHRVKSSVWYASTAVQCRDIWLMAVEQHQFYLDKRQASRVRYIFFTNILITVYSTMLFWRDYFELGRIKNNIRFTSYIIQKTYKYIQCIIFNFRQSTDNDVWRKWREIYVAHQLHLFQWNQQEVVSMIIIVKPLRTISHWTGVRTVWLDYYLSAASYNPLSLNWCLFMFHTFPCASFSWRHFVNCEVELKLKFK